MVDSYSHKASNIKKIVLHQDDILRRSIEAENQEIIASNQEENGKREEAEHQSGGKKKSAHVRHFVVEACRISKTFLYQ